MAQKTIDKKKSDAAKKAWVTKKAKINAAKPAAKKEKKSSPAKELIYDVAIKKSASTLRNELIDLKKQKKDFIIEIDKKIDSVLKDVENYNIFIEQEKITLSNT